MAHSDRHTLTSKSDRRSSPNRSTSSETWFSGHEAEDNNSENAKNTRRLNQESASLDWHRQKMSSSPSKTIPFPSAEDTTAENLQGSKVKDAEMRRGKFQRSDQFVKDRFDEWKKHSSSEQRKIDEMFMREALMEAKKAADNWEVPVGAVLVHDGRIVARGCNLVEELRDSTAHAEMLCIREASNTLRTWRLSDTTLYVTLEPCPMCAGAILQARIDTVVWGAPNKLLGADGSWIRLFPDGDGEKSLEPTR
ncbi:hypothetical protein HAX54_013895 [Datura stramonium]|uniref:tRNA(adenine(34)) deaminase n=1 Tax=Datura stramonium TaxID=4076 RepID=A0ABS8TPX0_DATST|nr:hypothetical protein [Datura stramonium]